MFLHNLSSLQHLCPQTSGNRNYLRDKSSMPPCRCSYNAEHRPCSCNTNLLTFQRKKMNTASMIKVNNSNTVWYTDPPHAYLHISDENMKMPCLCSIEAFHNPWRHRVEQKLCHLRPLLRKLFLIVFYTGAWCRRQFQKWHCLNKGKFVFHPMYCSCGWSKKSCATNITVGLILVEYQKTTAIVCTRHKNGRHAWLNLGKIGNLNLIHALLQTKQLKSRIYGLRSQTWM